MTPKGMTFLEANRIVAGFGGGPELPFLFAISGTSEPFGLYLEAACAERGVAGRPRFLPFNTLHQHLVAPPAPEQEILLLFPWDFVAELDWRTGVPASRISIEDALRQGHELQGLLARRSRAGARLLYVPAPLPPLTGLPSSDRALGASLEAIAMELGAVRIDPGVFSLASYFSTGCPIGGAGLGHVARQAIELLLRSEPTPAKVLVTDLDETLWSGLIAEEGPTGIAFGPHGAGYRHYAYQTTLARLRREGVLLAAVSRNDADVVLAPFRSGQMPLQEEDFVAILASYHAKSAQLRALATQLNLGLDAFVYVDDNPVELAEIGAALPEVATLAFPTRDDGLPEFLHLLTARFAKATITEEDHERTALYRRRAAGIAPSDAQGADLTRFLAGLGMRLALKDRSSGDRARAVQLINKTNQFNANGRRWLDEEIGALLEAGGRLLTATLDDRGGSHGEILVCLLGPNRVIEALVMSCRVFQRQVEFGFFTALADRGVVPLGVRFAETDRNEPFRQFLRDPAFGDGDGTDGIRPFDGPAFASSHRAALQLFEVSWS